MRAPVHGRLECGWYLDRPPQLLRAPGVLALDHLGVLDVKGQWGALPCLAARRRSTRDSIYLVALQTVLCCVHLLFRALVAPNPLSHSLRGVPCPYYGPANWVLHALRELLQEGLGRWRVVY